MLLDEADADPQVVGAVGAPAVALDLAAATNINYSCSSSHLLDDKSNSDHVENKLFTAIFPSMGESLSQGPCFVPC